MTTDTLRQAGSLARKPGIESLAMIALIIAGALVFIGLPVYAKLQWPGWLALFVVTAALWLWAVFMLRQSFGLELERRLAQSRPALRAGMAIVADVLLAAIVVVSITLLEDFIFAYDIAISGWRDAILYYTAVIFFIRTLAHLRLSLRRAGPAPVVHPGAPEAAPLAETQAAPAPAALPVNTGPLYYVQAEDHYVKMVFSDNVQHLRGRFRDVIAGLGDEGLQVQKSFWVSRHAVTAVTRIGRRLHLVLPDGAEIPVSRTMEQSVRRIFAGLPEKAN